LRSAGTLGYEILSTRIASVLLTSDHWFLVLGLALLGLAAGAIGGYFIECVAHASVSHLAVQVDWV